MLTGPTNYKHKKLQPSSTFPCLFKPLTPKEFAKMAI